MMLTRFLAFITKINPHQKIIGEIIKKYFSNKGLRFHGNHQGKTFHDFKIKVLYPLF